MTIIEDFIVNLAAGFSQSLLQHLSKRALQWACQAGFEPMPRIA